MEKRDFNKNWICRCLTREEPEKKVTLPHDAMRSEQRSEESQGEGNIGWYIGGDYEYTKRFFVPAEDVDKKAVLEFEGVYHDAEIYINEKKAAFRPYGYTNFYVELNEFLQYGAENTIRVIARNADQPNSRWYSGTGIYRPVNLYLGTHSGKWNPHSDGQSGAGADSGGGENINSRDCESSDSGWRTDRGCDRKNIGKENSFQK